MGKEGKGAKGSVVLGVNKGMSNRVPMGSGQKSSMESFGIDPDVIAGYANAVSLSKMNGANTGMSVKASSIKNFGVGKAEGLDGTVGAKENMDKTGRTGDYAKAAGNNSLPKSTNAGNLGSGARSEGTWLGKSMELARKGLSGGTGGGTPASLPGKPGAMSKSMRMSKKAL